MPHRLLGLLGLVALFGFIGFAFRQGMKVTPDRSNSNFGSTNGGYSDSFGDGSHSDGHSH